MENKYYTPTIEEFHVGFEYEYYEQCFFYLPDKKTPIWINKVFGNEYEELDSVAYDIEQVPSNIRIKYLDKEDIESLGFTGYIPPREYDHTWWHNSNHILKVWFNMEQPIIRLYNINSTILFHGTIKNKSELKVLLKQLGIE